MEQRDRLDSLGRKILSEVRTELYLDMHFLGPALDALDYVMDLSTLTIGTDAEVIRFNPQFLMNGFLSYPRALVRTYMHILIHCLFRHMFTASLVSDPELFSLCADIAAEALIDSMDEPVLFEIPGDFREEWLRKLRDEVRVLTAEKLYRYFSEHPRDYSLEEKLKQEFGRDDHGFWEKMNKDSEKPDEKSGQNPVRQREQNWKDRAGSTRKLLVTFGPEASDKKGSLAAALSFEDDSRTDYREFLHRLSAFREETRIDPDSFDYGLYHHGLELYGNVPLIEENEYREVCRIDELVIAIDTSASTKGIQVQKFLKETAAVLSSQETFFHHVNIHLIECDNQVQRDTHFTDVSEVERFGGLFVVHGGMGTDFRPVFRYVEDMRRQGKLEKPRALLYFTDGYGIFPEESQDYETAFVFCSGEDYDDTKVPGWALKLYTKDLDITNIKTDKSPGWRRQI
ncbi:MAG: metallopeptidase [Blautia sp.]|nr:metallopeptidase [Blautia sp.]